MSGAVGLDQLVVELVNRVELLMVVVVIICVLFIITVCMSCRNLYRRCSRPQYNIHRFVNYIGNPMMVDKPGIYRLPRGGILVIDYDVVTEGSLYFDTSFYRRYSLGTCTLSHVVVVYWKGMSSPVKVVADRSYSLVCHKTIYECAGQVPYYTVCLNGKLQLVSSGLDHVSVLGDSFPGMVLEGLTALDPVDGFKVCKFGAYDHRIKTSKLVAMLDVYYQWAFMVKRLSDNPVRRRLV